jgi:hypothetical protein
MGRSSLVCPYRLNGCGVEKSGPRHRANILFFAIRGRYRYPSIPPGCLTNPLERR